MFSTRFYWCPYFLSFQGDLELSIREAKEAALPTLPARDWLGQVREIRRDGEKHRKNMFFSSEPRQQFA